MKKEQDRKPGKQEAVLETIKRNKEGRTDYVKWEFKEGDHIPVTAKLPRKGLEGQIPIEGKVDSWGVLYFGGLFILANELTESCVKSHKLFVIPKFLVLHTADGHKQQFPFVMPHPENFNYLDKLVESVHEYAQDSFKGCGPLMKEDAALEDQKDGAGMPIQHPSIICSFPSTGVVTREALDYLGSDSKAITKEHKAFMKKELNAACGLNAVHQAMYNIA